MAAPEITLGPFDSEVTVRRTRYLSSDAGWAVVDAADDDGEDLVLVGPIGHLEQRERAHVVGAWVDDSRYGPQVKVTQAIPLSPVDAESVVLYLKRVKHVGTKRAAKLVDRYGCERVLDVIDADPRRAFAAAGLSRHALAGAEASWERLRATRKLHLLLAPHGLAYLSGRIHEAYGDAAHRTVSENPYALTSVFGVGFAIADRIARSAGRSPDDRERLRAGILHVLAEAERSGSTCLPVGDLIAVAGELLGRRPAPALVTELVAAGDLELDDDYVYRKVTAELEAELAAQVAELLASPPAERLRAPARGEAPDELTAEQRAGVE